MTFWLLSLALVASGAEPTELPPSALPDRDAIARAVDQLGAPQFSARQAASRLLWQAGLAAEPALRRAAQDPNREIRTRARRILDDFQFGILPNVPEDVHRVLRQFRDGDANQREAALRALAEQDDFERIRRLLPLEPDDDRRRALLMSLLHSPRAVEHFQQIERLRELVALVGVNQDAEWRQTTLVMMLFSESMIRSLAERDKLPVLTEVVRSEPSAEVRRGMLSKLFQHGSAVVLLTGQDRWAWVAEMLELEPQVQVRGRWMLQIAELRLAIKGLADRGQLHRFLDLVRENAEAEQHAAIVQRAMQHPEAIQAVVTKSGVAGLIGVTTAVADPKSRGKLLADIAVSEGVRQALNQDGQRELVFRLAAVREPAAMHNEYMKSLLPSRYCATLLADPDGRRAFRDLIDSEPPEADLALSDWRGEAVFRLLPQFVRDASFPEDMELDWLLGFLEDRVTGEQRLRILQRLLVDYRLQKVLDIDRHFDGLVALIKRTPDDQRGRLLSRLIVVTTVNRLAEEGRIGHLIALARDEAVVQARYDYLRTLFSRQDAMTVLIARGHYGELAQMLDEETDAVRHAELRCAFHSTEAALQRLQQDGQLDALVDFARRQTDPAARRQYLTGLVQNRRAIELLIGGNHFGTLHEMVRSEPDDKQRTILMSAFYLHSRVLERLAAQGQIDHTLNFVDRHLRGRSLNDFLLNLCRQEAAMTTIVAGGRLNRVLELVRRVEDKDGSVLLMRTLLGSTRVVEHYGASGNWPTIFAAISRYPASARHSIWEELLGRSDIIEAVAKHGGLDHLLDRIGEEPQTPHRIRLQARFLGHATAIEHWIARRGLPSICELVRSQPDAVSRQRLLRSLVAHRTAVQAILEADGFDELSDLVAREKDELQRSRLLVLWLAHSAHWIDGGRVDRVLHLASLQSSAVNRRGALFQIVDSRPAVATVNEGGRLNQLLTLCRLEVDPTTRRDLLLRLLESQLALGRLARTDDVVATLRGFLEDTRRDFPDSWLDFLLVRFALLSDLIERDHFGEVLRAIDAENDPAAQRRLNLLLLRAPHAILELVDRGRHRELARLMADEIRESSSPELLDGLLASHAVVQALVAGGGLEPLFERIEREDRRVSSVSLLVHLLTIPAAREQWFEAGYFDRARDLVETRWDAAMRKRFIQRLLDDELGQAALHRRELALWVLELCRHEGDGQIAPWAALLLLGKSRVRQHMVTHGQGELLHEAVRQLSDGSQRKQLLRALVYSPSGMIAHYVERGQFEEAEQLLDQYAHDDWGRQRLAAFWWISGRIHERIETIRPRFETSADQGDGRQLVYLYRANGDLDSAFRIAQELDDPGLQQALLVEMHLWAEASASQHSHPCPLPIPWSSKEIPPLHRQIERQGLTAAYQRLAGDRDGFRQTMQQVVETAAAGPEDRALQWFCAEALLLNGFTEEGLRHLAGYDPNVAFDLLCLRHQYRDALRLWGCADGEPLDQAWLEALPVHGDDDAQRALARVDLAAKVSRLLHALGRQDAATAALDTLETYCHAQPDAVGPESPRKRCFGRLCQTWIDLGQPDRAWQLATEPVLSPSDFPPYLSGLYPSLGKYDRSMWTVLRRTHPEDSIAATCARLYGMIHQTPEDSADAERLFQQASARAASRDHRSADEHRAVLARICLARDMPELAGLVLKDADADRIEILELLADLSWRSKRWDEAAERFEQLWQRDRERLTDLFVSGEALHRAGKAAEAERRQQSVHRLAIDSRARYQLVRGLVERGLRKQAVEHCRILLRTAPPGHLEWHEAARRLGEHLTSADPGAAADWFELSILDDLRTDFFIVQRSAYLRIPALIDRLRAAAAVAAGDIEAAKRLARTALDALPGDIKIAEDLVPRFEAAGHHEAADDLFDAQFERHVQWCSDWPDSAMLHDQLARLALAGGRRLDEALHHAKRAVELEPNAAYRKTLADVTLRLGHRDARQ
jgi:tetratricopeptide (TPR) repeat protein